MEMSTLTTPPAVFVGVSEADGRHNQRDFGQFLIEKAAEREHSELDQSGKVITFHLPVCADCGLEKPDHTKYCRYSNR